VQYTAMDFMYARRSMMSSDYFLVAGPRGSLMIRHHMTEAPCYRVTSRKIRSFSLLTRDEEVILAKGVLKGDRQSLNDLIESNSASSRRVAASTAIGAPVRGPAQRGDLGLIEAAQRFDHRKGTKFITYPIWWIRKRSSRPFPSVEPGPRPQLPDEEGQGGRDVERNLRKELGRKAQARRDL
jgi:DNA-directed RNA polymerase specialized sigma subunit